MKVLLDACVPRPLRRFLANHFVSTAQEMGWGHLKNGALLAMAEAGFEVFISSDQNLRYQQNLAGRRLAILILPTNNWLTIRAHGPEIASKLDGLCSGEFAEMKWD